MHPVDPAGLVSVVGAGTMGTGIAQIAALAGHPVILLDATPGRAETAVGELGATLQKLAGKGRLDPTQAQAAAARVRAGSDFAELGKASLVIEAAVENLDVKRQIFAALEDVVGDDAVLATNTSSLSISAIGARLRRPERLVGMHFFNPPPLMPLVEVVVGVSTDREVAAGVAATATAWGKTPVLVSSTPGFVVNRVARPFYGEALQALEQRAAEAQTIDAVLRECGGFRMGPLELTDLIGQDVNAAVNRSVWEAFGHDPRYRPSLAQQALVDAGLLGRKSGRGFYAYPGGPGAAATSAAEQPVGNVVVGGDWGPWEPLWSRVAEAGVAVTRRDPGGERLAQLPGVVLAPTDGRTATDRARGGGPVALVDLLGDAATATRIAVTVSDGCPAAARSGVVGVLQATGAAVTVLDDLPGMLVARTVAMLVNEAVDVVGCGVASAGDVDLAMRLGVGYPRGPLEWGDALGADRVVALLDALADTYRDGRHRACPALRRAAVSGRRLRDL